MFTNLTERVYFCLLKHVYITRQNKNLTNYQRVCFVFKITKTSPKEFEKSS